jgi:hypothetical protein
MGVGHQHHLATVLQHGAPAFLEIELVIDQHDRGQIMTPPQFAHQPMHARLRAEARRACRHLRDEENSQALLVHLFRTAPLDFNVAISREGFQIRSVNEAPSRSAPVARFFGSSIGQPDAIWRICISSS